MNAEAELPVDLTPAISTEDRARAVAAAEMVRDRTARDSRELAAFAEVVAVHFGCPRMAEHDFRIRVKGAFTELRSLAISLGREAS